MHYKARSVLFDPPIDNPPECPVIVQTSECAITPAPSYNWGTFFKVANNEASVHVYALPPSGITNEQKWFI